LSFYKTYLGTLKKRAPGELHDEDEPVDVYPEIVAAINSFVHNRDMRSGYYAYFDIGGGTLDGIVFDYNDVDGRKEIDVITASVQPLGVEKVCSGLLSEAAKEPNREENHRKVNSVMTAPGELPATVAVTIDMHKNDQSRAIKRHVAGIIVPIKMNDTMLRLDKQDVIPLYLGGGGAGSHWYVQRITATYKDHQHARCNIPPYRERRIEEVSDLKMEENRASVNRFLVAYGLSVPRDENLDITGLPDKHENDSREIIRKKIDSEAIQMEIYGEIN
jgi:hypothetical protein